MTTATAQLVRLRTKGERATIHRLRAAAEQWLAERGQDQFQPDGPSQAWRAHELIDEAFDRSEFWGLYADGRLVAVGAVKDPDPDFWTPEEREQHHVYVARFMVAEHGQGYGERLLAAIAQWARTWHVPVMRLDCWRTNEKLRAYYERLGFRLLRVEVVEGRGSGALFELDLTRPSLLLP